MNKATLAQGLALIISFLATCIVWPARIANAGASTHQAMVLQDVRILSETGNSFDEHMSIKIENGVIKEISKNIDIKNAQLLNLQNKTLIPGLIDAHVHLKSIPGSMIPVSLSQIMFGNHK